MTGRREPGRVQSVCKAMDLLSCLAQARGPLTLGELSTRTGIPKATAHGLLSAMRPSAVVEQSAEDGRYRLGVRLFEYGCAVSRGWNVLEAAAELVKLRSRQYAKRQLTWLRRNPAIHWIFWEKDRDFARALQISTEILSAEGVS